MIDIEKNISHEVSELMCLRCMNRWIGVYPEAVLLKDLECKCGAVGYVIKTGQTLPKERLCDGCDLNVNDKCKLGLSMTNVWCEYKRKGTISE